MAARSGHPPGRNHRAAVRKTDRRSIHFPSLRSVLLDHERGLAVRRGAPAPEGEGRGRHARPGPAHRGGPDVVAGAPSGTAPDPRAHSGILADGIDSRGRIARRVVSCGLAALLVSPRDSDHRSGGRAQAPPALALGRCHGQGRRPRGSGGRRDRRVRVRGLPDALLSHADPDAGRGLLISRRVRELAASRPMISAQPPPPTPPPPPDDAARQTRLDTMRRRATGLLVFAALVFVVARFLERTYPWLGFVRATAEASLVGGLADWFAVTALFRRPLGLPIPHTAIVATQKDRIGRILGNFVQRHFLSNDVVAAEVRALRPSERAARWAARPENSSRVARQLVTGVAKTIEALPEAEFRELIHDSAVARLQATRVAPVLGGVLALVTSDNRHHELLNALLNLAAQALDDNRDAIRHKIREGSPWWVPGVIDDVIYQKIIVALEELLLDVRADPRHPVRRKFDAALEQFIDQLQHAPDVMANAEALNQQVLALPVVDELAASLWDAVRRAAVRYRTNPAEASQEGGALERGIDRKSTRLNSSHANISYAVFCLKKKNKKKI